MKALVKDLIRSSTIGVGIAMAIFSIVGVVFDLSYGGNFHLEHYQFTKMVLGSIAIGLGFGIPSIVYRMDSFPFPIRVIIHMGIGMTVYMITAYAVGWIGAGENIWTGFVLPFLTQLVSIILIWLAFFRFYKKEAKKMNDKIQSLK